MTFEERVVKAKKKWDRLQQAKKPIIFVGAGTCGIASGADELFPVIDEELDRLGVDATVISTGCIGTCFAEPLVDIQVQGFPRVCYSQVTPKMLRSILRSHLGKDKPLAKHAMGTLGEGVVEGIPRFFDLPALAPQVRLALRNCGFIDPMDLDHYLARGGYQGFAKALGMAPEKVIEAVEESGLRGRGGGGFGTGRKWRGARAEPATPKYVVCNADEGDPGAFMDRSLLEGDPHAVLEGMTISAYAIGDVQVGYVYVRAEYPLAVKRLRKAVADAKKAGLLGKDILGSGFDFDINIFEGAGAFVCGESSALMYSIEGKRGMPRVKPPQSVEAGVFGKPTSLNNVETFANVGTILRDGPEAFSQYGTEKSKGTKTFALAGKINRPGLIEVPLGIPLGEVVEDIGGGISGGGIFKAAQTGGPSGGCLPARFLDTPIDYESLAKAGSIMGSGGLVIMDDRTCMVDLARYFLTFTRDESCGKCVPCRVGTQELLEILERICAGGGQPGDIELLEELSATIKKSSLCGLGKSAPNPLLTTIRYFREEYEEHIHHKRCRAAVCKGLVIAPCNHTCPAGVEPHRYIRAIGQEDFERAYLIVRERLPMPRVCALVCPHPCEKKCRRGPIDDPLAVRALKRATIEFGAKAEPKVTKKPKPTGKSVAIVGSGPAGLTAGYYLSKIKGHAVTIFESAPKIGGMLRYGITRYHLPEEELEKDLALIKTAGVKFKTKTKIESLKGLQKQGFDAIFLGLGAHLVMDLKIKGRKSKGILDCAEFLRDVNSSKSRPTLDGRVVVIGGGNVAIDAARTALRVGAEKADMYFLESREEMPAFDLEISEAEEEGVTMHPSWGPERFLSKKGNLTGVELKRCTSVFDKEGRFSPKYDEETREIADADYLILAIGQYPDVPRRMGIETGPGQRIVVNEFNLETSVPGVYAGGDAVTGPASVVDAMAHGRRAAEAIDSYLGGNGDITETLAPMERLEELQLLPVEEGEHHREPMRYRSAKNRTKGFSQVELGFTRKAAVAEATRCLRCDLED